MNVVFVHGIFNSGKIFWRMKRVFEKSGFSCFAPTLKPIDGHYGIEDLARKLGDEIDHQIGKGTSFTLVGFSMGGIVARYYLQELGGNKRVNTFIAISAPHYGTYLAFLYPGKGAKQLRPNSTFLKKLSTSKSSIDNIKIYCYWTPFDFAVIPPTNSKWEIAENKKVYVLFHPLMLFNKRVISDILILLK